MPTSDECGRRGTKNSAMSYQVRHGTCYDRIMRRLAVLISIIALAPVALANETIHVKVQGRERRCLLHVPVARGPMPLVLMFHGGGETPENTARISGFNAVANREHFIVAYPEGIERSWNDGRGTTGAAKDGVDDVAFVRALITEIRRTHNIDGRRIYATGVSNGGIFTNRLGCEMSDTFAAIGPVIGSIASGEAPRCHPSDSLAVIGMQGEADPFIPFEGGEAGGSRHIGAGGRVESARATQRLWASLNGCAVQPRVEQLPVANNDGTSVTRKTYGGCRAGTEVVWYEIAGGGHRWPGHPLRLERTVTKMLGAASMNIDATETIWAFFKAHAKRGADVSSANLINSAPLPRRQRLADEASALHSTLPSSSSTQTHPAASRARASRRSPSAGRRRAPHSSPNPGM